MSKVISYDIHKGVQRAKSKFDLSKILMGLVALAMPVVLAISGGAARAITGSYTLFGDAQLVSGGNPGNAVQIRSDATIAPGFGGISYGVLAGTTFADLDVLSTDFMPQADDLCVGGSPRFSMGIDTTGDGVRDGSIWAYFGVDSGSPPCVAGAWQNTGDLLETGKFVDSSQLGAGEQINPYDNALASYGAFGVTSLTVVVDSSWAHPDGEQTFLIDNTNTDGTIYTYETKESCKKAGWMSLTDADDNSFKNQGDCVSYVATGGRNTASGN